MKKDAGQDITSALKRNILGVLKKKSKPALTSGAATKTQGGAHIRRTRIITILLGLTSLTAAGIVLIGFFGFIWTFTNLDQFLGTNRNSQDPAVTDASSASYAGTSSGEPASVNFSEVYDPQKVLAMMPAERKKLFTEVVHFERSQRQTKIARQLDERGMILKRIVTADDGTSRAVIQINGGAEQAYSVGDDIDGIRVLGISVGNAFLFMNGKKIMLSVNAADKAHPGKSPETKVEIVSDSEETVNSLSPQDSQNREKLIGASDLMGIPARGFKVNSLQRGDPLSIAGLKEGDLILSINGIPLVSDWATMEAYRSIGDQYAIPVEYEREGKGQTSQVHLR